MYSPNELTILHRHYDVARGNDETCVVPCGQQGKNRAVVCLTQDAQRAFRQNDRHFNGAPFNYFNIADVLLGGCVLKHVSELIIIAHGNNTDHRKGNSSLVTICLDDYAYSRLKEKNALHDLQILGARISPPDFSNPTQTWKISMGIEVFIQLLESHGLGATRLEFITLFVCFGGKFLAPALNMRFQCNVLGCTEIVNYQPETGQVINTHKRNPEQWVEFISPKNGRRMAA